MTKVAESFRARPSRLKYYWAWQAENKRQKYIAEKALAKIKSKRGEIK